MVRSYRIRRGLKGSATEDWLATALAMQTQPHTFVPREGRETCWACGLPAVAEIHDEEVASTAARAAADELTRLTEDMGLYDNEDGDR